MRHLRRFSLIGMFLLISSTSIAQQDFRTLHREAVVVDGHNDVLGRVMHGGQMESWDTHGHSDLQRFRYGGLDVQVFSIWVPSSEKGQDAWNFALAEIDTLKAIAARNPDRLCVVTNPGQLQKCVDEGRIAGIIGLEGGRCIDGKRDRILALYHRGMRSFGLTWNYSSDWASCSKDESTGKVKGGLSAKGKSFVRLLDSLGVLVDVSHLGEQSFWDVLAISTNPVIASHSSCTALRNHHRNLTDRQLRALAEHGGVVMINFYPGFIADDFGKKARAEAERLHERHRELKRNYRDRGKEYLAGIDRILEEAREHGVPSIATIVDHIDHAVKIAGVEHVGLGSDFDGISITPVGLEDVTDLPLLTRALQQRGYSDPNIRKILGGNFLRVFKRVTSTTD